MLIYPCRANLQLREGRIFVGKRIKKPTVKPEQRQDWLLRYEAGESPPKIAEKDSFDVRTVRRHIEQAKQEKEVREARLIVLRSALENHYADFCRFAERIEVQIAREEKLPFSLREDRLWSALKQHLPRSPLWSYLNKWDELHEELVGLEEDIIRRFTEMLELDPRLREISPEGVKSVIPGVTAALAHQMKSWAKGSKGLTLDNDFHVQPTGHALINVSYGSIFMNNVIERDVKVIKDIIRDLESKVTNLEEYRKLQKLFGELERLKRNVRDELAIITMRRVVPGRCKYCPI
jgi:hypothetical protein